MKPMVVLVYEDNLMWGPRLAQTLRALGHTPLVRTKLDLSPSDPAADAAIINLGSPTLRPGELVPGLHTQGVFVIGHAGHKELELHELGRDLGCDVLATNRELTYSLDRLLRDVPVRVIAD